MKRTNVATTSEKPHGTNYSSMEVVAQTTAQRSSTRPGGTKKRFLGADFVPGPFDVICARGKQSMAHEGNKNFRLLIWKYTAWYGKVSTKLEKGIVVLEITDHIREMNGMFVKQDAATGSWFEVDEVAVREKIGQNFQNALSHNYKSSCKRKIQHRHVATAHLATSLHRLVISDKRVHDAVELVKKKIAMSSLSPGRGAVPSSNVNKNSNKSGEPMTSKGTTFSGDKDNNEQTKDILNVTFLDGATTSMIDPFQVLESGEMMTAAGAHDTSGGGKRCGESEERCQRNSSDYVNMDVNSLPSQVGHDCTSNSVRSIDRRKKKRDDTTKFFQRKQYYCN